MTDSSPTDKSFANRLPPAGTEVIVYCQGYRCLGYMDAHHRWRTVFSNEELHQIEGWSHISGDEMIPVAKDDPAEKS